MVNGTQNKHRELIGLTQSHTSFGSHSLVQIIGI